METHQTNPSPSWVGKATFLAALLMAGALMAAPAVGTLMISFQNYTPFRGIASPFVGLRNYQTLFQASYYGLSLLRTLQFSALSALVLFAAGTLAGYVLRAIPVRWLRHGLCTLLMMPLLVPGELWAQAFFAMFTTPAVQSLALLALWSGIKYIGLPVLLTTAAHAQGNRSAATPILSAAAMALALFALLGLQDYAFLQMLSPLSAMQGSMDLFVYRQGMQEARFGVSSAVTVVAVALRAGLLAAVAWPVAALVRRLFPKNATASQTTSRERSLSLLAAAAILLAVGVALTMASRGAPMAALSRSLMIYPVYVILACVSAAINTMLCFCLARPVVTARQPALRQGATAVLLVLTALGAAPIFIGGYFQFRALGMVNTLFPVLFSGIGSVLGVWPLVFAARAMGVSRDEQWLRRMWRPSLALLAVGAALRMNDTLPNLLYFQQASLMHPLLALTTIQAGQEFLGHSVPTGAIGALITLVTMVLPVILMLVVRTAFTEQETVGLGLPTK